MIRLEGFHVEAQQTEHGRAQIHRAVRAVHDHGHSQHVTVMGADDVDGFLDAPAFGHHVFDHEEFLAGSDAEPAAQDQFALFFFREDKARPQLPGHFLANHQSAHGGRNDRCGAQRTHLVRQSAAQLFHVGHVLQREGALKILAAVQAAAENEMPFEQRARPVENSQGFFACHPGTVRISGRSFKANSMVSDLRLDLPKAVWLR